MKKISKKVIVLFLSSILLVLPVAYCNDDLPIESIGAHNDNESEKGNN